MIALWTTALLVAVLWPAHTLSAFDGVPLSGAAEAIVVGVALPALWWLHRRFLCGRVAQLLIVSLAIAKAIGWVALPQHGLCAAASTRAPFAGTITSIPIEEPTGALRSWDLRADWRDASPRCTAIVDRAYASTADFPAWYRNLLAAIRPDASVDLRVSGYLDTAEPGALTIETGRAMTIDGTIDNVPVRAADGRPIAVPLDAGAHAIALQAALGEGEWAFRPLWNGRDAWKDARFTVTPSGRFDRTASPVLAALTTIIVVALFAAWGWSYAVMARWSAPTIAWTLAAIAVCAACGAMGRFDRFAALALVAAAWVPVASRERHVRGAFMLIGAPWLALFVARGWPLIGRVTLFSSGDDWQMYQAAAYRIVMNGYWIQGGTPTFLFQPFYRWVVGILHLIFGDSSVGELYVDAICLLMSALLVVAAVRRAYGYRAGVVAGALTLSTFTLSSIWYLIGRSLSEITALGFMTAAAALLIRARRRSVAAAIGAGVCATLMFYTRLNHLLITGVLLAWLLPLRTPMTWRNLVRAAARVPVAPAAAYVAVIVVGVLLFAFRTWWYAGHFSVLYGTSFGVQQTGFRLSKMAEAVAAQITMREPPAFDPRSVLVVAGAVVAALAWMQVPGAKALPAALAIMTVGTIAGSFVAHTHDYPGRMSLHVVPFAVAMSICAAARTFAVRGS